MNGIYYLANDAVIEWLSAALAALRAKGCTLPVCIIPFDENIADLRRLATRFDYQIVESSSLEKFEELGRQFHPHDAVNARMFRRFASFEGPFERFIYSDTDVVALMNWQLLLDAFLASGSKFWYFDQSPGDVYKPGALLEALRANGQGVCLNGGVFAAKRGVISYEQLAAFAPEALKVSDQFAEAAGEQPFINYYIERTGLQVESASKYLPDLYDWNWAASGLNGRSDVYEVADGTGSFEGKRFAFIHWSGFEIESYMPHATLFRKYRLRNAPLADQLRYGWEWTIRPIFGNMLRALKKGRANGAANAEANA